MMVDFVLADTSSPTLFGVTLTIGMAVISGVGIGFKALWSKIDRDSAATAAALEECHQSHRECEESHRATQGELTTVKTEFAELRGKVEGMEASWRATNGGAEPA